MTSGESVGLDVRRLVLIRATRRGAYRHATGYFVTNDLVLTASHVVAGFDGQGLRVRLESSADQRRPWRNVKRVEWKNERLDAALLRVEGALPLSVPPCDWGVSQGRGNVQWMSCGYPDASVALDEAQAAIRVSATLGGTLCEYGGHGQGRCSLELTVDAAPDADDWKGVSGAPVFVDHDLIGILTHCPRGYRGRRLAGLPAERLREVNRVRKLVPALGWLRHPADRLLLDGTSKVVRPITRESAPARLLVAGEEVVPFFESLRPRELKDLSQFCRNSEPFGVLLLFGSGGTGKTRLLIEWCKRLRAQHWTAGFLPTYADLDVLQRDVEKLLNARGSLFIAIDYAETNPDLFAILKQAAESRRNERLRIVLAARGKGDWWQRLIERSAPVLEGVLERELTAMHMSLESRRAFFKHAAAAFARLRGKTTSPQPPALEVPSFDRPLYVEMAALAAVDGLKEGDLVQGVLLHEEGFWLRTVSRRQRESVSRCAREAVAAVTLIGGLTSVDAGGRLLGQLGIRRERREFVLNMLRDVYPDEDRKSYVSVLQPDLLGEALVHRVLCDPNTSDDYTNRVCDGSQERELVSAFTVLGRIALAHPGEIAPRRWIENLLAADLPRRALPALKASIALARETPFAPIGDVLADALGRENPTQLGAVLASELPKITVSLQRVAVWALTAELAGIRRAEDALTLAKRAQVLNDLGNSQGELGLFKEALASTSEAVQIRRRLAQNSYSLLPDLAASLNNLAVRQGEQARLEEALASISEAVSIRRELVRNGVDASLPGLGTSLGALGVTLSKLDRRDEALASCAEAVKVFRELARARSGAFLPGLAKSLSNLGIMQAALGQKEASLQSTAESMEIFRSLALQRPDEFLPDLAAVLDNIGTRRSELGLHRKAFASNREAIEIRLKLAKRNPEAFLPECARSLSNLGMRFGELGNHRKECACTTEAVRVFRYLCQRHCGVFESDLARGLHNLGNSQSALGLHEQAVVSTREAVEIRRRLADKLPDAFAPQLARSLNNLATSYGNLGRREEALETSSEAVAIVRRLAPRFGDRFLPDLALTLETMADMASALGRPQEAVIAGAEAVEVFSRVLAKDSTFAQPLARSLRRLAEFQEAVGRKSDSAASLALLEQHKKK